MTEPRLRTIVAIGQWATSWLIAVVLILVVLHVTPPEWMTQAVGLLFAVSAPTFLVAGMILCVRLPGWRKWIGLTANTVLIVAGVALIQFTVASSSRVSALAELDRIHASADWKATTAQLDQNAALVATLTAKIASLPPDFISATAHITDQIDRAEVVASGLRSHLTALESAVIIPSASAASAFEIAGPGSSSWITAALALLLAVSNEAIALALMWDSGAKTAPEPVRTGTTQTAQTTEQPRGARLSVEQFREIQWTDEERQFLGVKQELERQGLPSGYREVCVSGNMNLGACKRINSQILRKIETARSTTSTAAS